MKSILLFSLFLAVIAAVEPRVLIGMSDTEEIDGGITIVTDEVRQRELVELLREHIGKLEEGNWDIIHIFKVGTQVVAGIKYYYYGTFIDKNENKLYASTVTLYLRPWDRYTDINMQDKTQIQ
ncbi:uncharacterized protein [Chironomus tepperi]|uniref:uncharacterized protein isoform X1 n=1 Tax=Chironomus tepperi TaxID=113505 RepID=UPI00391F5E4F